MSYAVFLLSSTWVLVHFFLLIGEEKSLRNREEEKRRMGKEDVHRKLMRAYKEVPHWWYIVFGVLSTGLGVICIEVGRYIMLFFVIFFLISWLLYRYGTSDYLYGVFYCLFSLLHCIFYLLDISLRSQLYRYERLFLSFLPFGNLLLYNSNSTVTI